MSVSLNWTFECLEVRRLGGAGSDYSAFVQHIGVPSADIAIGGGKINSFGYVIFSVLTLEHKVVS